MNYTMTDQDWWLHLKDTDYSLETFSIYADWLEDQKEYVKSQAIKEIIDKQYVPYWYKYCHEPKENSPDMEKSIPSWWIDSPYINNSGDIVSDRLFRKLKNATLGEFSLHKKYYTGEEAYKSLINALIEQTMEMDESK